MDDILNGDACFRNICRQDNLTQADRHRRKSGSLLRAAKRRVQGHEKFAIPRRCTDGWVRQRSLARLLDLKEARQEDQDAAGWLLGAAANVLQHHA
jgi:hypothetical protein